MKRRQVDAFEPLHADEPIPTSHFVLDPHAEFSDNLKKHKRDARRRFKATLRRERTARAAALAKDIANLVGPTTGVFQRDRDDSVTVTAVTLRDRKPLTNKRRAADVPRRRRRPQRLFVATLFPLSTNRKGTMAQRKSKKETNGVAAPGGALALPTITRAKAQELLHARAVELYQDAKSRQQDGIARFESEYGRADRIDPTLLRELQHLQMRFAAIAARQLRSAYSQEPKVSKFVKSLGEIIGDVTVHLATDNALELFAQIDEQDYLGYSHGNGSLGRKGYDASVLEGYQIVDEPKPAKAATRAKNSDDEEDVCLHAHIQPYEDDATRGVCSDCGEEFVDLSKAATPIASVDSEPHVAATEDALA